MTSAQRTQALTDTLAALGWFAIPHTLDQIVGVYAEALGETTRPLPTGRTSAELAELIGNAGGVRTGHHDPTANHRHSFDDADHTLGTIDAALELIARAAKELDDYCALLVGHSQWMLGPTADRQAKLNQAVSRLHHAQPNIEPAAHMGDESHINHLLRTEIAETADWLRHKCEAIWKASRGDNRPVAVQRKLRYCKSCARWDINELVERYAEHCRRCGDFHHDYGVEPTERICRMWFNGQSRFLTEAMVREARMTKKGA